MNNISPVTSTSIADMATALLNPGQAKPKIMQAGCLMHRFPTDKSIDAYCQQKEFISPQVRPDGSVWVNSIQGVKQIGWIS